MLVFKLEKETSTMNEGRYRVYGICFAPSNKIDNNSAMVFLKNRLDRDV